MLDHEQIYRLTHAEDWSALLALIHAHPQAAAQDELVQHALATFEQALFARLDAADGLDAAHAEVVERLVLLHSGGFYRLDRERFATLVVRLVTWQLEQGAEAAARQYAPFCPDREPCASLLDARAPEGATARVEPRRASVDHPAGDRVQVTVTTPATAADHTISLFKSPQEATFFQAVRAAFPTHVPYPNVALSSVIDIEAVRPRLPPDARTYFFKATVDCVVCDPHDAYRPMYFFELDSRHHDDPDQHMRDTWKDAIIAAAGHRLYRLRPRAAEVTAEMFRDVLRGILYPPADGAPAAPAQRPTQQRPTQQRPTQQRPTQQRPTQ